MTQEFTPGLAPGLPGAWRAVTAIRVANAVPFLFVSLIFLAPNALLALSLRGVPAFFVLAGVAGAGVLLWRETRRSAFLRAPADIGQLAACVALGVAVCLLGGEGHFFFAKSDWLTRDAVLADLVRDGVTTLYRLGEQEYLLRAPLGMYLIPATIGRAFGLYAAHRALLAQNALLIGVLVYFVGTIARAPRAPTILLLLAFSGLDIVGVLAAEALEVGRGGVFMPFSHMEWWSLYFWPGDLQYSSFITQIFWVPNHAAPGWWIALLVLLHLRGAVSLPAALASFAPLMLWSPLIVLGAAPFLVLLGLRRPLRSLFAGEVMAGVAANLCFLPIALYLVIDAGAVPHGWLILQDGFARQYAFFILLEIPQAALVFYCFRLVPQEDRAAFRLAVALLLILPVYGFGPANDLLMRCSIPALFILAFEFARVAVLTRSAGGVTAQAVSILVLVGAATPLVEIKTAIGEAPWAASDCNLLTASQKLYPETLPTNYLARVEKVPAWLVGLGGAPAPRRAEDRMCWPHRELLTEGRR